MAVLRAKQKLNGHKKYAKVRICSCESLFDRVNRINTSELIKLMGREEEFVIVGNGLLKSKAALKEQSKARANAWSEGGAHASNGDAANDDDTSGSEESDQDSGDESTRGSVSDNGDDRDKHKQSGKNLTKSLTNQRLVPVTIRKTEQAAKTPKREQRKNPSRLVQQPKEIVTC